MTQPFPHHPRAPTLHSRLQPGTDVTFKFIPASVRGPARGKAGEVRWVRTLAKILQLGCSKPLGSLALPLAPSRVDSFRHTHTQSPASLSHPHSSALHSPQHYNSTPASSVTPSPLPPHRTPQAPPHAPRVSQTISLIAFKNLY